MNLVGKQVKHMKFGKGSIIEQQLNKVVVQFNEMDAQKAFQYPQGFEIFLKLQDNNLKEEMLDVVEKKKAEMEQEKIESDRQRAELYPHLQEKKAPKKKENSKKSNIAIRYNHCNGGSDEGAIGYRGVCSKEMIQYNIEKRRHIACKSEESPCRQYYEGTLSREALEAAEFCCHEFKMLKDWRIYPGVVQTGAKKGQPMAFKGISSHMLALLTTRLQNEKEEQRAIFAVFMVKGRSTGNEENVDYIEADPHYRIELSLEEAKQVRFWDFYFNENKPEIVRMGSGLHKYMTDNQSAQILKYISEVKTDPAEKEYARHFFEHYCAIKQIDAESITAPEGALKRIEV